MAAGISDHIWTIEEIVGLLLLKLSSVGVSTMRIDNNDPNKIYKDFWDWLFNDWHIFFIVSLIIGYFYYLISTTEA